MIKIFMHFSIVSICRKVNFKLVMAHPKLSLQICLRPNFPFLQLCIKLSNPCSKCLLWCPWPWAIRDTQEDRTKETGNMTYLYINPRSKMSPKLGSYGIINAITNTRGCQKWKIAATRKNKCCLNVTMWIVLNNNI